MGQEGYIPESYIDLGGLSDVPAPLGVEALNAANEAMSGTATADAEQDLVQKDVPQDAETK